MTSGLVDQARAIGPELIELRHQLHAIPEVGLELPATQSAILAALGDLGLEISTGRSLNSVTAVLRGQAPGGPGPVVLLRSDMDALPLREESGLDFAPKEGSPHHGAMHACGHDLHMASLVGAARLLHARRAELTGDVVLMFQPGEEGWGGAGLMIDEGVLDAAGRRADAAYGLHVIPATIPHGVVTGRPGKQMAASLSLSVEVIGTGGPGSQPHQAADPVMVIAEIVTALQTMVTRSFDVFDPVVLTVGSLHAGSRRNVIPERASLEGTARMFSEATAARLQELVHRVCAGIAAAHGVAVEVRIEPEYPPLINDETEFSFVAGVVADLLGTDRMQLLADPITGSEDFALVLREVPGAFVFVGTPGLPQGSERPNHSPHVVHDEQLIPDCAALLAALALRRMAIPA